MGWLQAGIGVGRAPSCAEHRAKGQASRLHAHFQPWLHAPLALCTCPPFIPSHALFPRRCAAGAERLQEALDELWPDDQDQPSKGLGDLQICPGTTFKVRRGVQELLGRGEEQGWPCCTYPQPCPTLPRPAPRPTCRTGGAAAPPPPTAADTPAACGSSSTRWPAGCPRQRTQGRCGWRRSRALWAATSSAASAPSTSWRTPRARRRWLWPPSATPYCGCGTHTTL